MLYCKAYLVGLLSFPGVPSYTIPKNIFEQEWLNIEKTLMTEKSDRAGPLL